jgi:DNA-binding NtrC family response regulator
MPGTDGLALLKEWASQQLLTMPVVMMSGHGTIETALEAIRVGAIDFLEKPIALQKLLKTVAKAIQQGMPAPVVQENKPETAEDGMVIVALPLNLPLREAREYFDGIYFNYQMQKENSNLTRIAESVGIERTHLYRKLKQLGIKPLKKGADSTEQ